MSKEKASKKIIVRLDAVVGRLMGLANGANPERGEFDRMSNLMKLSWWHIGPEEKLAVTAISFYVSDDVLEKVWAHLLRLIAPILILKSLSANSLTCFGPSPLS